MKTLLPCLDTHTARVVSVGSASLSGACPSQQSFSIILANVRVPAGLAGLE